jgi:hypothetical protein
MYSLIQKQENHMSNIVVHLGSHRTGTTLLQQHLLNNQDLMLEAGVECLCPPRTRNLILHGLMKAPHNHTEESEVEAATSDKKLRNRFKRIKRQNRKIILSEENIIGQIRYNRETGSLFPHIVKRLQRFDLAFENVDIFYLSIRELSSWWVSCFSQSIKESYSPPGPEELEEICLSERSWKDVIQDIRNTYPNAILVVREFGCVTSDIKTQLKIVTGWSEFDVLPATYEKLNVSMSPAQLETILKERGDFSGAKKMAGMDTYQPFTDEQIALLNRKYQKDLKWLLSQKDEMLFFLDESNTNELVQSNTEKASDNAICLLHIGKCGGTYLRSYLNKNTDIPDNLLLLDHPQTLLKTLDKYGPDRKLAFIFRDPTQRFISAFNSRLRQGRPTYDSMWNNGEAIAFQWFETPNSLAEALYCGDERLMSAARFTMKSIQHLNLNYQYYLGSVECLKKERKNIIVCSSLENLDANLPKILKLLGIHEVTSNEEPEYHRALIKAEPLTKVAEKNLRRFWQKEYEIVEYCREIEKEI